MITRTHLELARTVGERHARNQIEDDEIPEGPDDDIWEILDVQEILFEITGEKIEPNSEDGWLLIDNIENAYYDYWWDYTEDEVA